MTITAARDEIRARRRLVVLSRNPWRWEILSTDGARHHHLSWDQALHDVICDSCVGLYGVNRCWARGRVLAFLRTEMEQRRAAAAS